MKKNILLKSLLVSFVMIMTVYVYHSRGNNPVAEFTLANIEALAASETLPPVEIVCGAKSGPCWVKSGSICFVGSYTYDKCMFAGYTWVSCSTPC